MTVEQLIKILKEKPKKEKIFVSCKDCGHTETVTVRHFETGVYITDEGSC